MSQPPQPPNQPPPGSPGGGFGAPQTPPPGQPPQNAGGYGYPPQAPGQAPGQPPQTPPQNAGGYGYPPQAPAQAPGQPPQTPPQNAGGYGYPLAPPSAPQTPPPGGFPGQPPQTPPQNAGGYGYPQAPASAPQTPPPGIPGQPVHAQPTQVGMPSPFATGGQQQYGYPPQAAPPGAYPSGGYPAVPGTPGGSGKSKQRMMVIVSAVVAVALAAGVGIFFATKDDPEPKPKPGPTASGSEGGTEGGEGGQNGGKDPFKDVPAGETVDAELLAKVPMPKVKDLFNVPGVWATDKVFAKAGVNEILGFSPDGRSSKWKIPLDGEICWSSAHVTEDGKTAVLFEDHKPKNKDDYASCSEVGLIDLDAGKMVWQKHIAESGDRVRFDEVTIGGGTVAAGGSRGGAAWSLAGKELWKPTEGDDCADQGYAGGSDKLVAVHQCGEYSNPRIEVQTVDPTSGSVKSSYTVPSGIEYVHVASTDPLIIGFDAGDSTGAAVSDFLVIDDSAKAGKLRSKIATLNGQYTAQCESVNVEGCGQLAVSKEADALFMATEERPSSNSGAQNEIVAFSLKTGKAVGKADGVAEATLVPLGLDKDGYVIVYQESSYSKGGGVWRIHPTKYEKTQLLRNPDASAELEGDFAPNHEWVVYGNGRLYLGAVYADKPSSKYDKDDPLAMVFGASS
ncbi:hypothetical protein [Streptomyces sp. LX-29]|uniref:hypothetical protein n=1 Tax=Streptomyces sp. LX-29 TaxID=2900152 RepID=UPI00240E94BC|nr:hypothetical protein [Streptomyces sp. LX-29]